MSVNIFWRIALVSLVSVWTAATFSSFVPYITLCIFLAGQLHNHEGNFDNANIGQWGAARYGSLS